MAVASLPTHLPIYERIQSLCRFLNTHGWESYDPYDGLKSPVAALFPKRPHIGTRLWQQGVRVMPINLRPVLGIKPMVHTKAVSDFLSAFCLLSEVVGDEQWEPLAQRAAAFLNEVQTPGVSYPAWGLRFPFVTRFVYAADNEPNVFQTINAIHAFLDHYQRFHIDSSLGTALGGMEYLVHELGFEVDGDQMWWRYWAGRNVRILNVSGLMLGLCARLSCLASNHPYCEWGHQLYRFLATHQNGDGSWYYAVERNGHFVDGYHTGYILEGLVRAVQYGLLTVEEPLRRGVNYYLQNLIAEDAIPMYYRESKYPVDGQLVAQSVQTLVYLSKVGLAPKRSAWDTFTSCDRLLWNDAGFYNYQKRRLVHSAVPMHRWVTGPMMLALAHLLEHTSRS